MTREQITERAIKSINEKQLLMLQLATGFGKSKIAIDCINSLSDIEFRKNQEPLTVNIVVPTRALIGNWKEELKKWYCKTELIDIKCYNSLYKMNPYANVTILDEAHHLSQAKQQILLDMLKVNPTMKIIALSATLTRDSISFFKSLGTYDFIKCSTVEAINEDILPNPMVYLIPMELDMRFFTEEIIINPKKQNTVRCSYANMWSYKKNFPDRKIIVSCTPKQYYTDISSKVEWYKNKYMVTRSEIMKNKWLKTAKDRLDWLATQKNTMVQKIVKRTAEQRYCIFCTNIEQANILCKNAITSKSDALGLLNSFNEGRINHISSCIILNEGHNLVNCRIGIFANLNASDKIGIQRIGRLLRHKEPVLIAPFFRNTRDEEIIKKMFVGYDKNRIICTESLNEIRL